MLKFPANLYQNQEELKELVKRSIIEYSEKINRSYQLSGIFILLPIWFHSISNKDQANKMYRGQSAYIVYHWESFSTLNNSLHLALAAQYSNAFILLRAALETITRGSFFECLAHEEFRNSLDLEDFKSDKKLIQLITKVKNYVKRSDKMKQRLENTSAGIYDLVGPLLFEKRYQFNFKTLIQLLIDWGLLTGIDDPIDLIYNQKYAFLSRNVHIMPDMTDIGKELIKGSENPYQLAIFNSELLNNFLYEFNEIIDIGLLISVNIMSKNLSIDSVKQRVSREITGDNFRHLPLTYTRKRIIGLLNWKSI